MAKGLLQLPPEHARIDWTHPITRGLLCAWTANNAYGVAAGGGGILASNGRGQRLTGFQGTISRKNDFVETTAAGCCIEVANTVGTPEFSFVANYQADSGGFDTGIARILECGSFAVQCSNSGVGVSLRKYTSGSGCNVDWDNAGLSATEWKTIGLSSPNSVTATDHILYVDGAVQTQTLSTNGTGSASSSVGNLNFFNRPTPKDRSFDGRMRFAYLWNRSLTPSEQRLLALDPFCLWTWEGKRTLSTISEEPQVSLKSSSFTTIANATRSSGAINLEWANLSNATSSDNARATITTINPPPSMPYSGNTHYLKASQLENTIPSTAIPLGIRIGIERRSTATGVAVIKDSQVYIVKGGTIQTTQNKADTSTNYPTSDTIAYYGAANDLWGQTWTATDINGSGFGVVLSVNIADDMEDAGLPEVDQIFCEVTYIGSSSTSWTGDGAVNISVSSSGGGLLTLLGSGSPAIALTTAGSGIGSFVGNGASNITFTTSGTPKLTLQGSASPNINFAGYLQTVEFGAGSSTVAFTTSAIGSVPQLGAGSANVAFTGASGGFKMAYASATALLRLDSSMNGLRTAFGAASANLALISTAQGLKTLLGASSGQITVVTDASGSRTTYGTASGSVSLATSMNGLRSVFGSASPTLAFTGQASALKTLLADASSIVAFTVSTGTKLTASGGGQAAVAFVATAQALKTLLGTASADIALSALAIAAGTILGEGSASIAVTGQTSGLKTLLGSGTPTIALTTSATGTRIAIGNAVATITVTGATAARLTLLGASNLQINLTAQALIDSGFVISFVDEFTMNIEWQESRKANLSAIANFILPITPSKTIKGR